MSDKRLKRSDVVLYAAMSSTVWQGNYCRMGTREMARVATISRRLVLDGLRRLVEFGHIVKADGNNERSRGQYILSSQVFASKQRDNIETVVSAPNGRRRLATVRVA